MRQHVHVKVNRHGRLAYRLYVNGRDHHEGTGLADTAANRAKLERRAEAMRDEIESGTFDYLRWFPNGNGARFYRPAPPAEPRRIPTLREYAETTWLPRKVPPVVRASLAGTYRWAWRHVLRYRPALPAVPLGDLPLDTLTVGMLEDFRLYLLRPEREGGRGVKLKTARDIIDASFRALYRDARAEGLVSHDPFAALKWPRPELPEPDPFTEAERDTLLAYFWRKNRHYHALVFTMFYTGLRTGEAVGLRWGNVDLRAGVLRVRTSRTLGEDNTPKTRKSKRDLALLPDVAAVLRAVKPLHADERTFVFPTQHGTPLDEERFVEKHWRRALRAAEVRPRKFYAARHTFMTWALGRGVNVKWLADYCGTSLEMIERHYADRLSADPTHLAPLVAVPEKGRRVAGGTRNPEPYPEPSPARPKSRANPKRRGGDSNSRGWVAPWRFSRPLPSAGLGHPSRSAVRSPWRRAPRR
jgi:integrase